MFIKRTYNKFNEYDFLTRVEGNCPVWTGDQKQAMVMSEKEADETLALISTYRFWTCPNGIQGMEITE